MELQLQQKTISPTQRTKIHKFFRLLHSNRSTIDDLLLCYGAKCMRTGGQRDSLNYLLSIVLQLTHFNEPFQTFDKLKYFRSIPNLQAKIIDCIEQCNSSKEIDAIFIKRLCMHVRIGNYWYEHLCRTKYKKEILKIETATFIVLAWINAHRFVDSAKFEQ